MPDKRKNKVSFDDLIARKRKQDASKVASMILGKNRGKNAPADALTKPRNGSGAAPSGASDKAAGDNGKWKNDLFHKVNPTSSRISKVPGKIAPAVARSLASNRLFAALHSDQVRVTKPGRSREEPGFSIRGSAGPAVLQADNFAPGTTAEDIKHAMSSLGKILSCIVLTASPVVICEIVFEKKEAADRCIAQYDGKRADGRILHIFYKNGPPVASVGKVGAGRGVQIDPYKQREEADRRRREANMTVLDGTYGVTPPLYSDAVIQRGRGFVGRQ